MVPGCIKFPAVSSKSGVQKNKKSARHILKELSIIPTTRSSLLVLMVFQAE
jgi:hypothetical protein